MRPNYILPLEEHFAILFYHFVENADSCSMYSVDFLRYSEVLTGNSRGHMKVWDLRNDRDVPVTTFMLSDQVKVSPRAIDYLP